MRQARCRETCREKDKREWTSVASALRREMAGLPATRRVWRWRGSRGVRLRARNRQRRASSNAEGICQATRATAARIQQTSGWVRNFPSDCTGGQRRNGPSVARTNHCGRPWSKGKGGRAKKDERRNDQHEENVLDHVDGERSFVEGRERRTNREPEEEHAS